jgi:Protein of unknown function (DUF3237)
MSLLLFLLFGHATASLDTLMQTNLKMLSLTVVFTFFIASSLAFGPKPPTLTYLYTVNITFPPPITISPTLDAIPITGGAFAGPKLKGAHAHHPKLRVANRCTIDTGTVLPIGADFFGVDAAGNVSPDAAYVLQTDDGANILVRAKGHAPVEHTSFQTGSEKYTWLNTVVGVASGVQITGGFQLSVWQVRTFRTYRWLTNNALSSQRPEPSTMD